MYLLGQCYRYGRGLQKNPKKGFMLQLEAAKSAFWKYSSQSVFVLAEAEGVPVDPEQAFRWYLVAARRGHKDAAHNVAYFYETGRGVRRDKKRAEFWYSRAKQ